MHNRCFQHRFEKGVFVDRAGLRNCLTLCNKSCVWIETLFVTGGKVAIQTQLWLQGVKKVVNVHLRRAIAKHNLANVCTKSCTKSCTQSGNSTFLNNFLYNFLYTLFWGRVCFSQLWGGCVSNTPSAERNFGFFPRSRFLFFCSRLFWCPTALRSALPPSSC